MKHPGEIEEHIFDWLNEGYSIPQIHAEMDRAVIRFRKTLGYQDVNGFYKS